MVTVDMGLRREVDPVTLPRSLHPSTSTSTRLRVGSAGSGVCTVGLKRAAEDLRGTHKSTPTLWIRVAPASASQIPIIRTESGEFARIEIM